MSKSKAKADRPILWLVRKPQGLIPYSDLDAEFVERYRIDSHIVCTIEQPRDAQTVRKFHGLVGLIAKATGKDFEGFKRGLIVKAGFWASVDVLEGIGTQFTAMHISDMDQAQLQHLWERTVETVLTDYLPHIREPELAEKVERYIGVRS